MHQNRPLLMLVIVMLAASLAAARCDPSYAQERLTQGRRPSVEPHEMSATLRKPTIDDTIRANIYADNWFILYITPDCAGFEQELC